MACTPAEIEQKRLQALQKLAKSKTTSPIRNNSPFKHFTNCPPRTPINSPKFSYTRSPNVFKGTPKQSTSKPYDKQIESIKKQPVQFYGNDPVVTIKFLLLSEERFYVELSSYCIPAIDIFKTVPTRNYDPKTRNWDFNFKDYDMLIGKLQGLHPNVVLEKFPLFLLKCLKQTDCDNFNIDMNRLDSELGSALMPFQIEGLSFGVKRNGRCLIADDMGLGKTFQALAIANYYKENWPLLIVTTSSMKNTWEETIHKYIPSVPMMQVQYMTTSRDFIGDSRILIVSHDMMSRAQDKLMEKNFGVVIIDESHVLKNFKAKCTKAAQQLAKKAKQIVLLSGTPALSRPSELYCQLALLDEKFFGSFFDYSKRYCDGKNTNFGWDASGKSNLQELELVLSKKFMIRRTKEQVLKTLPNKTQQIVKLDVNLEKFDEVDRKCLNALAEKYRNEKKGNQKHALLLTLFSETAKIKIPSVCSYILQVLEAKRKFLVFAHHQIMLDSIEKILKKKEVQHIRIDGNTNSERRKYLVDKFQLNDNYLCALLSITAANAGITLTAAQLVLFAELHWNPSILSQAESRAHRIGQENPVIVRYLIAQGTADDSIWPLLEEKQKILSEIGLSKDNFDEVDVRRQDTKGEIVTEGLNLTICEKDNITKASTLDITSYFITPEKKPRLESNCLERTHSEVTNDSDLSMCFDDGFDDILCNIDI